MKKIVNLKFKNRKFQIGMKERQVNSKQSINPIEGLNAQEKIKKLMMLSGNDKEIIEKYQQQILKSENKIKKLDEENKTKIKLIKQLENEKV